MLTSVTGESGKKLDAKVEVEDGKVVLHSRGGAFGKPNLRNPDYREALVVILSRLLASKLNPARVLVDSREAHKVAEAERVLVKADELRRPVEELVAMIGKRVAAFGREPGVSGHGNQTKRVLVEVPEASENEILAVLRKSTSMPSIIYFNIGWMKHYAGASADDPTIGGHGWLADNKHGLESFNFLPTKNGELQGYRPPGKRDKVNIDRLGAKPGEDAIEGVLAVWLAREPGSGKTLVVGWYRSATVYREARLGPFYLNDMESEYSVMASKEDAILVPIGVRSFQVSSSRTAPGEGFGQKPTWYGAPDVDRRVWAYVNGWDDAKKHGEPTKGKLPPRNTDPELRRKVEKAAVRHAWNYYETKYGKGSVESVEPYGRGWDLEVRSGDVEWLVEVKGLLNAGLTCELTPNEYEKMCSPEYCTRYVVYVVNNALAEEPAAPVPSIFTWKASETWLTEDGRELQVAERVGAMLTCK
ncbi:DUF3883 domain-containing protein (plasmid) [Sphingomonas paeninsulae]|uniref:DUF3883 domain-containing protein n=1 Tax=Sphingomonas paeninsulae TaxID=2319844 RepID=A0A494TJ57_SPHPE|nr:DUF3883 domain-containing protein [Sphingomonas paeninsulae]AYJ85175.1 DUF3883 domain-containing protein [Sphingomonas paeninsulae]